MSALVLYTTFSDTETASRIAQVLVEEGLAACCNILPQITSIYQWEGEVQKESEVLVLIKTTRYRYRALQDRLIELHPYDVPEVLALPVQYGSRAYLDWIEDVVGRA
ncbi:MAG: divalent-cation tolerance protein CutA [Chlorobi bacterium]|nr:divalent-cation tolerance protein CutA [Chlorobiota bacterium]